MGIFSNGYSFISGYIFLALKRLACAGVACALLLAAGPALADEADSVKAASLEVKSRIFSMERVNVTAEVAVDESAPAANATVAAMLAQLEDIDKTPAAERPVNRKVLPAR